MARFLVLSICLGFICQANAQDCVDYSENSYWFPNPVASASGEFIDSAVWNDKLVLVNDLGASILDFPDQDTGIVISSRAGSFTAIAVHGDMAVLFREGSFEIVSLPSFDSLGTGSLGGIVLDGAVNDELIAVLYDGSIEFFDISDPETPLAAGEIDLGYLGRDHSLLGLVLQEDFVLVGEHGRPASLGGHHGDIWVINVEDPYSPAITDHVYAHPYLDGYYWCLYTDIIAFPPGFIVAGYDYRSDVAGAHLRSFLTRFFVTSDGRIDWQGNGSLSTVAAANGQVVVADNIAFLSTSRGATITDVSWDLSELSMQISDLDVPAAPLRWLPSTHVLAAGIHTYHIVDWVGGWGSNDGPNTGLQVKLFNGDVAVSYYSGCWYQPSGGGCNWNLCTYDITQSPAAYVGGIGGDEDNPGVIFPVGDRVYFFNSERGYVEVSESGQVGPRQSTYLQRFRSAMCWGEHVVVSNVDDLLVVYQPSDYSNLIPVVELPVSSAGELVRVVDHLYVSSQSGYLIFDMSDPSMPVNVANLDESGRLKCFDQETLFSIEDDQLTWYSIADPSAPLKLGEWKAGTEIWDVLRSDDFLYIALAHKGLCVMDFSATTGPRIIGGRMDIAPWQLDFANDGIMSVSSRCSVLPLACGDPLPVSVGSLGCTVVGEAVHISFAIHGGQIADAELSLWARHENESHRVALSTQDGVSFTGTDRPLSYGLDGPVKYEVVHDSPTGPRVLASRTVDFESPLTHRFNLTASPNPFNPRTTISFDMRRETEAFLRIFDVSGRLVDVLIDGEVIPAGRHEVDWHGWTRPVTSFHLVPISTAWKLRAQSRPSV